MNTCFAISKDGKRIAYDVNGEGPAIILLHGGRQTRSKWHELGYVERLLKANYKVITVDIRGNGESDKPIVSSDYRIEMHCGDILAVADACRTENFTLCGYSYGGNIGRYLASTSSRISKFILIGIPFGPGAQGDFRQLIVDFRDRWAPILEAEKAGTLEVGSLSIQDKGALASGQIPLAVAWPSAMLEWAMNEPKNLLCPTLWIIGSKNDAAMASLNQYGAELGKTKVTAKVLEGLTHEDELLAIDTVYPLIGENLA
jgi:pimeloyl-ACP methyl ester carboxylesterase